MKQTCKVPAAFLPKFQFYPTFLRTLQRIGHTSIFCTSLSRTPTKSKLTQSKFSASRSHTSLTASEGIRPIPTGERARPEPNLDRPADGSAGETLLKKPLDKGNPAVF